MTYDIQFVDRIAATPTVRLDVNAAPWSAQVGTEFGTPELRRSVVSTLLVDGDRYPAAAYGGRVLTLRLRVAAATDDDAATQLQLLYRELDRPTNILRYRPGTSQPVFFRTHRCGPDSVTWDPFTKEATVQIPAEPFALGLKETLSQVTVYNDPAEGTTLNSNPYFETDASGWTASGGTIARSTAQFHEGTASLLLTPSGSAGTVEATLSGYVALAASTPCRVSAWVRCAVARSVRVFVVWSNGSVETGSDGLTVAVAANTWTLIDTVVTAPAGTTRGRLAVSMDATPLASHLLHIDEARIRQAGGAGGMCFDVTSPKGDVEAPLYMSVDPGVVASRLVGARQSVIAVRRRGTPSAAPFVLQAEAMTAGTDTTVQANNTAFSGAGSNWTRTTFATVTAMATRLQTSMFPAVAGVDVRGTYRVFMRYRQSAAAGSPMNARLQWGANNGAAPLINGDPVALVVNDAGIVGQPLMKYADLGLVQFPADYDPRYDGLSGVEMGAEGVYLAVQVERTAGSTSLDVDLVLFVPADDRLLAVRWPTASVLPADLVVDSDAAAVYARNASGQVVTLPHPYLSGGTPMVSPGVTNRVYFLRDVGVESSTTDTNSAGDSITATTPITPYYWPRYLYTRPPAA